MYKLLHKLINKWSSEKFSYHSKCSWLSHLDSFTFASGRIPSLKPHLLIILSCPSKISINPNYITSLYSATIEAIWIRNTVSQECSSIFTLFNTWMYMYICKNMWTHVYNIIKSNNYTWNDSCTCDCYVIPV